MIRLKLVNIGRSRNPFYPIVAVNQPNKKAKPLDILGTFNPIADEQGIKHVELDFQKAKYWIGVGSQFSLKVHWLFAKVRFEKSC